MHLNVLFGCLDNHTLLSWNVDNRNLHSGMGSSILLLLYRFMMNIAMMCLT